ncbi:MAG: phenylalanine--tRNA ligase subunit beta [Desulfobulbaceae bacterium]|nr:phenylalanine--tRNA ligase subunit beta [Desulfobulbaceae bacterium]
MKFTLSWLKNYVDTGDLSAEELAEKLTMLGLEVDSVTPLFQDLGALFTGLVVEAEKHPDADKLTICQVQIGEDTHQIVCGAPNVRQGLAVVVALPGTVLPGNFKIKKSKIRGVASSGMICSERELGLSNEHDGIMELPEGTEHGQVFIDALKLSDICIEVDLTPNRPDCASVIGVAREVSSFTGTPLKIPVTKAEITTESQEFDVEIQAPELCPRYAGRLIKNVKIGPSPWWLRKCLLSVGLRPINNIVDITNFVMLEYGQPLHAFDFDNLSGGKIIVRTPSEDELSFSTLDESERKLGRDMLMICDGEKPVAVAGVMGGLNSEVSDQSTTILLESACFNAVSIRKTARNLNLSTDASYRFERGVDPEGTINALNRATQLICELSGGQAADEGIDRFPGNKELTILPLSVSRTNTLLGIDINADQLSGMLESIDLSCTQQDSDNLSVTVPSFRVDLEREADLVEEVARLYGYNNIPTTLPSVNLSYPEQDSNRLKRLAISKKLTTVGYTEAINYSFISDSHVNLLKIEAPDSRADSVKLLNPLSEDQAVMRTTLLPGLLENVKRNINFQKPSIKFFELGKVFTPTEKNQQPIETTRLAGVLSGNQHGDDSSPLYFKHAAVDIFDAKGTVEFILREMALELTTDASGLHFKTPDNGDAEPFTEAGQALNIYSGDHFLGSLGKIEENILRKFSIKNTVYFFDLNYDGLCQLAAELKQFSSLPVYPSVKRDIALVVSENISAGELLETVKTSREKLLEATEIFDVFQGEKIPEGYKSVALTITYRSQTKTLTEKNVEKSHSKIVRMLTDKFGGSFRNA